MIAARGDNQTGGAGACWACSILPIKAMNAQGLGDEAAIAAGIVRATDAGARVINLSLGSPAGSQPLADAVSYAEQKGVLVVAAAGNSGTQQASYPATYPGVISVAASDDTNQLYPWSNYGNWVSLAAPGCNIAPALGGGYDTFCGTSSATPLLAGIAALALSANPALSSGQIATALAQATLPLSGTHSGLVQAPGAFAALDLSAPAVVSTTSYRGTLGPSTRVRSYHRTVNAGTLTLTLTSSGLGRLTLTTSGQNGHLIARRTSTSPLRLTLATPTTTLHLRVSSNQVGRVHFTLTAANLQPQ